MRVPGRLADGGVSTLVVIEVTVVSRTLAAAGAPHPPPTQPGNLPNPKEPRQFPPFGILQFCYGDLRDCDWLSLRPTNLSRVSLASRGTQFPDALPN